MSGSAATTRIIDRVREAYAEKTADENLVNFVKDELRVLLEDPKAGTLRVAPKPPTVYLIAGVNGSGKTTSIAKLLAVSQRSGKHDPAGRLRYVPRRGRRSTLDLGRSSRL